MSTTSDGTNTQTNDGGLFAQRRVLSYTQLLTGEMVAQRTIDKLGLDMTAAQLQREVTAAAPTDTVLIDVTVRDASAARARDIANTLSEEFVVMAAGLETPDLGARPNAQVVVQQRANIPDHPVTPKTARNLAIGAVLGAVIGVLIGLIRDRLDRTVKNADALEKATGLGLVGDIPLEPRRRKEPAISFASDHSSIADAFRELRTNVQALEVGDGRRVLLVASAMPGDGRTFTAINLSLALAQARHNVVLVDGDLRRPQVAAYLGMTLPAGLSTVLTGEAALTDALQKTHFPCLTALTSGAIPPDPAELLGSSTAKDVFDDLGRRFDYVIVDSPSLLVPDAAVLARRSQGVLVTARFGSTTPGQLTDALDALRRVGAPLLGAVLTMTPATKRKSTNDGYYGPASGRRRRGRPPT